MDPSDGLSSEVENINEGMLQESTARYILIDLGIGDKFVCQLTLRTLEFIRYARGPILMMGTGTHSRCPPRQ